MSVEHSTIGSCPHCGTTLNHSDVLIEYETGLYVECPACGDPVRPTNST